MSKSPLPVSLHDEYIVYTAAIWRGRKHLGQVKIQMFSRMTAINVVGMRRDKTQICYARRLAAINAEDARQIAEDAAKEVFGE